MSIIETRVQPHLEEYQSRFQHNKNPIAKPEKPNRAN
jgi:hypothetical protein